jgi:eight-cysteine-cluster-containing protein
MRSVSHALALLFLLTACACPQPSTTEEPAATSPELAPGTQPAPAPSTTPAPSAGAARTPAVAASDPLYSRVEGTTFQNACQADNQCFVGGCSSEICTAEEGVSGTCEMPATGFPSKGATCGCVAGQCIWYRAAGTGASSGDGAGATGGGAGKAPTGTGTATGTGSAAGAGAGSSPGSGSKPTGAGAAGAKPDKSAGSGAALPKQTENCTADYKCGPGLTCKRYRGIAGAAGPEFKTCEIPCSGKGSTCPAGQTCVTIADGPGQVCRPK